MPIIATAGHVDHGKSTLIEALTGRDPDRWAEEKERGLTIDLGFAWRDFDGLDVGFVDVPGHERFIKNMLAGVGALDVGLFVVAADEGWMPQSEEHLGILDILETRHGVIAMTRIDLADADTADLTELQILESIEGTSLSEWPIVRVSAVTGTGMEDLVGAMVTQLRAAGPAADMGLPRLWVDRAFHISGAGLVVTGTLVGGSIDVEDDLMLWPGGIPVRVRGMQHHDSAVTRLAPGTRTALNITGAEKVSRGAMLAKPGTFRESTTFLGTLHSVRSHDAELTSRGAYHLHIGSGSWPVQLRVIDSEESTTVCLVRSADPIPIRAGDRFILRETGRKAVVGGGVIIDPHPPMSGQRIREALPTLLPTEGGQPNAIADALLAVRATATSAELAADSGGGKASSPFVTGATVMAETTAAGITTKVMTAVESFHKENRLRPGLPKAELASMLGVEPEVVSLVIAGTDALVDDGATLRSHDFNGGMNDAETAAWGAAQSTLNQGLGVPRSSQLGLDAELLHALVRDTQLVKISDDLVYLPGQIDQMVLRLHELGEEFTVAEFRDLFGITRRQAVPLLEWFDKSGITARRGDVRVLRQKP